MIPGDPEPPEHDNQLTCPHLCVHIQS
jgi:hypothetical protein